jgi:hypothetical protein
MRRRLQTIVFACAVVIAITGAPVRVVGQAPASGAARWNPPRTPWGDVDLQGFWTNATPTPLERPSALAARESLTDVEVAALTAEAQDRNERVRRAGDTGTYNSFWQDRGTALRQTSLIVDPSDGRLPALTVDEQRKQAERTAYRRDHPADSWEDLSWFTRCVTRGLPGGMLPGFYNHNYQILQAPGYVVILLEMIHDARVIPLDGRPRPGPEVRQWMGVPRGRWEGDTLVVETTNFNGRIHERSVAAFGAGETLRLTERFTLRDRDTIDYRFSVDDPMIFTRPWTAAIPMTRTEDLMYEYACHEGNYGLLGILSGTRAQEAAARKAASDTSGK